MQCILWLLVPVGVVFIMMTLLRWFEQTEEAVDQRWWGKLIVLIAMPFSVWLFPGRVGAGRAVPVPRHEPVRGFGAVSKAASLAPAREVATETPMAELAPPAPAVAASSDGPPPGTPPEFLGMPVIPPKPRRPAAGPDPEKLAKLRQKMREQGMLQDEE